MEHEVLEKVVKRSYEAAIASRRFQPVSFPVIEKADYSRGKPLTYEAQVDIRPSINAQRTTWAST